jgi:hypothetical protein
MPWLVTWEGTPRRRPRQRIAGVFDTSRSGKQARQIVEALYATHTYSAAEMVQFYRKNPYPAEFDRTQGVQYEGEITCGHNPYLRARIVNKLTSDRHGRVTWEESPPLKP